MLDYVSQVQRAVGSLLHCQLNGGMTKFDVSSCKNIIPTSCCHPWVWATVSILFQKAHILTADTYQIRRSIRQNSILSSILCLLGFSATSGLPKLLLMEFHILDSIL